MTEADLSRIRRCETQLSDFLNDLVNRIPADNLCRAGVSGKWSARETLAHLARYHEVFMERLTRIAGETAPVFARYQAEEDPGWATWKDLSLQEILSRLPLLRQKLVEHLKRLDGEDFKRTGIHSKVGEMNVGMWLEFFLVHEGHHLYTVLLQSSPLGANS